MLNFPLLNETKALLPEVILTPLLPEYEKVGREVGEGVVTQVTLITPLDIEMLENCCEPEQLSLSGLIETVDPSNPDGITTVNLLPESVAEALLPEVMLTLEPVKLYEPRDVDGIAEQSTPKFPDES